MFIYLLLSLCSAVAFWNCEIRNKNTGEYGRFALDLRGQQDYREFVRTGVLPLIFKAEGPNKVLFFARQRGNGNWKQFMVQINRNWETQTFNGPVLFIQCGRQLSFNKK